jgi:molybdopterin-synthase adenylyltransferase
MTDTDADDRYSRQLDIVPPDALRACRASVIGVGAIGRQVALQLTAMGTPWLELVDHDVVETSNLASQGYLETDLGRPKVEATAELCRQINSDLTLVRRPSRFRRSMALSEIVFVCVDSIDVRRHVWEAVKDQVTFFCDGRMAAEVLRVLVASDGPSRQHYPTTLFPETEAHVGACTAKTTIYCANVAAGFMVAQFAKWLRRLPVDADTCVNLLSLEVNALAAA